MAENYDLTNIHTPVNAAQLRHYLLSTHYDVNETEFLVSGFENGFDLGYRGPVDIRLTANNLKFTVGNEIELWNKVMKEVQHKRYAGPFTDIPFKDGGYIQSPIGLVPKDHGLKTRLIFHLSYPRRSADKEQLSVNANTPPEMTSVSYPSIDDAIRLCLQEGKGCYLGKSDMTSAFRHFAIACTFLEVSTYESTEPKQQKVLLLCGQMYAIWCIHQLRALPAFFKRHSSCGKSFNQEGKCELFRRFLVYSSRQSGM